MSQALFRTSFRFPSVGAVVFRPLEASDREKGFREVLSQLSECAMTDARFDEVFAEIHHAGTTRVVVAENTTEARVVAAGTLIVERKFIHAGGLVGHIEDIVVSEASRGQQLGRVLIEALLGLARAEGCYKVVLDCKDHVKPFYEKCGLRYKDNCMAVYFPEH